MSNAGDGIPPHMRPTKREMVSVDPLEDFDEQELTKPELARPAGLVSDPASDTDDEGQTEARPLVEVAVIHEKGAREKGGRWRAFEVWTSKRVYAIDGQMLCIGVIDRATGRPDEKHAFIGARLMGGESKDGEGNVSFSYPLPAPGGEAVFQIKSATRGRYGHTSPVERVVLRLRVSHASVETTDSLWDDITSTLGR